MKALLALAVAAGVLAAVPDVLSNRPAAAATGSGTLVVALSSSLADVGTAVSLVAASQGDAVVLAESPSALGGSMSRLVARQQPQRVLIVGGVAAVGASIEAELHRLSVGVTVERLAGTDRIHTAALAAERALAGTTPDAVIVVNGWSLPDVGTAASAVATGVAHAVLYSDGDGIDGPTRRVLARYRPRTVLIAGGTTALSAEVESQAAVAAGGARTHRLGGTTRVETAALVAQEAFDRGASHAVVADGWSLPDVGVAAALAAALGDGAVLYATNQDELGTSPQQVISEQRLDRIYLVGEATTLSERLRAGLADAADDVTRVTTHLSAVGHSLGITPPAQYIRLEAGEREMCAIRDDATLLCWDEDYTDIADTPAGRFTDITSGYGDDVEGHWCGIRADQTIACWGLNEPDVGQASPPKGTFVDVAASRVHSCALRTDGTIACWGENEFGKTDAPDGTFLELDAGRNHTCALRTDGTIACWGHNYRGRSDPPAGRFVELDAGRNHTCALRADGTIACWGEFANGLLDSPAGTFNAVSGGSFHSCALRTDGTIACWGVNSHGESDPPAGRYVAISVGSSRSCALRDDRTPICWGLRPGGWASTADDHERVAAQAVYVVPRGVEPVSGRREAIAASVAVSQRWFRAQTGGLHPVFESDGAAVSVKAIRTSKLRESAGAYSAGRGLATEVHETLGLAPFTPLLIFVEGRLGELGLCGWTSGNTIILPIANCSAAPVLDWDWPYGATYLIAHELTHLMGAAAPCAPNYDGTSHVSDSNRDVIYAGPRRRDWDNLVLDFGNDDYYLHGRDDCPDIADHPLLRSE